MPNLNNQIDLDSPSKQEKGVYNSKGRSYLQINKQDEGVKHYFRLINFNQRTMDLIGIRRPELTVKKYMFYSPVLDDEGKQKFFVTTSESTLMRPCVFEKHVLGRLAEMISEDDVDGLNKHNKLFSGKYSRKTVSPEDPIKPREFGVIEKWVPVIPVDAELKEVGGKKFSVPIGEPVIYNIKSKGRNALFGKNGMAGAVDSLDNKNEIIYLEDGVDFFTIKNGYDYVANVRRTNSTIDGDLSVYESDDTLPDAIDIVSKDIKSEEACYLYDVIIGRRTIEEYNSWISESNGVGTPEVQESDDSLAGDLTF